jgi:hypothetical protein
VLAASEYDGYYTLPLRSPGRTDKLHTSAMKMKQLSSSHHETVLTAFIFTGVCVELVGESNIKISLNALLIDVMQYFIFYNVWEERVAV